MKKWLFNLLYPITIVIIVLLFWYIASIIIDVELILPTPLSAIEKIKDLLISSDFWVSFGWTYLRCIESFIIAFVLALFLSVLAYVSQSFERFMNPLMSIVRAVPTMAIILILIISIRPFHTPIVVASIVICPTLYQSFLTGFKGIDQRLVEMVEVYQVPKSKQITHFYIPCMLPVIIPNSATSFSLNIKLVIAAEALAQTGNSIGKLMQFAKVNIEIDRLFALAILAVIISMISEAIIKGIGRLVIHHD